MAILTYTVLFSVGQCCAYVEMKQILLWNIQHQNPLQ